MSTFRLPTLVIASLALVGAALANHLQGGKGPVNVYGPTSVTRGTSGNFSVQVDTITRNTAATPGDTFVDISADNGGFHPSVSTLRIPAGSNMGYFSISVDSNASGNCQVVASNSNGAAGMVTSAQ